MMKSAIAALLVLVPVAAWANVTAFSREQPYLPVPRGAAVILNTGSTNASGYRIVVARDGRSEYVAGSGHRSAAIPKDVAAKFFDALQSAAPLQDLPRVPCMKSASFGASLFVWWRGQRSPDLTCVFDPRGKTLVVDASAIAGALHISSRSSCAVVRPLLPAEMHRSLPTPQPRAKVKIRCRS